MNSIIKKIRQCNASDFDKTVWLAALNIPAGRVSTYKEIATKIGRQCQRAVGNSLNKNPFAPDVPCHRVVRSNGCVGGFASGQKKKSALLKKESIIISNNRIVDFKKVLFNFSRQKTKDSKRKTEALYQTN